MVFVVQAPESVQSELSDLVSVARERLDSDNHESLLQRGSTFVKALANLALHANTSHTHLRRSLRTVIRDTKSEKPRVADFCCGIARKTVSLAKDFPESEIYGLEYDNGQVKLARRLWKRYNRLAFEQADVYDLENLPDNLPKTFDVVTFHKACGGLADKIIQYATSKGTKFIAGRFCCYGTLSPKKPISKSRGKIVPDEGTDRDLLSRYAQDTLGIDETELLQLVTEVRPKQLGETIMDLNRILKLDERGYTVAYNSDHNLVVARRA